MTLYLTFRRTTIVWYLKMTVVFFLFLHFFDNLLAEAVKNVLFHLYFVLDVEKCSIILCLHRTCIQFSNTDPYHTNIIHAELKNNCCIWYAYRWYATIYIRCVTQRCSPACDFNSLSRFGPFLNYIRIKHYFFCFLYSVWLWACEKRAPSNATPFASSRSQFCLGLD